MSGRLAGAGLVLTACLAVYWPSLVNGLPQGASHNLNISWARAFIDALDWSTPYPRWLPSLWDGAGGADLTFYAPLPFYLTALIDAVCPGCSTDTVITLAAFLLRVVCVAGFWGLMSVLGAGRIAVPGALLLAISHYQIVDWTNRQAFGELAGIAFVPLCLWGTALALRGRSTVPLIVGVALLSLSHLPSLMLTALAAGLLAVTVWWPGGLRPLLKAGVAAMIGLLCGAVYWMPAIALLPTVNADLLGQFDWRDHFLDPRPETWIETKARLWPFFVVFAGMSLAGLALARDETQGNLLRNTALVLLALTLFLVTELSWPLWAYTPLVQVQFPWRSLMISDLAFAITGGLLAGMLWRAGVLVWRRVAAGMILTLIVVLSLLSLRIWWIAPPEPLQYPHTIEHRLGTSEWLGLDDRPFEIPYQDIIRDGAPENLIGDRRLVQPGAGVTTAEVISETGREVRFRVTCDAPCTVVIRRTYWAYWEMTDTASGARMPLTTTEDFPLISARLPAGAGDYRLRLTDPPVFLWAGLVSLIALLLTGLMAAWERRRVPR